MKEDNKIKNILNFTCDCGYSFKDYRDDIFKFSASEFMWMQKVNFIICLECKKKYSIDRLEMYMRQNKIKNITDNVKISNIKR